MRIVVTALLITCGLIPEAVAQDADWSIRASNRIALVARNYALYNVPRGDYDIIANFKVDKRGNISQIRLSRFSKDKSMNAAAVAAIQAASPLPAPTGIKPGEVVDVEQTIVFHVEKMRHKFSSDDRMQILTKRQKSITAVCGGC
ncbi:TonB family protein [Methylobacterium radiotolerans]|uniref:TonB family protein n=1 Tax=Methylobacterium radiotolerans TaxID=31998 RepID=UPI0009D79081|nr:TonB family protein [Methylobacterium radiotolerans]GEN01737.1 hypothetical protein MRA01_62760 [Methylobacterium radiotolerans]